MTEFHQRRLFGGGVAGRNGASNLWHTVRLAVQRQDVLQPVDTGAPFLHLRYGGGELLGRGYHQDEQHDIRDKKLRGEPAAPLQHHAGAEKQDAHHHTVAQEVTHGRRQVDPPQHTGTQAGVERVGLAEAVVGEVDGSIGFDDLQPHDGLLHQGGEEGIPLLQLARAAAEPVGDAGDDKDDEGQHAEDEEGEPRADIEEHGQIEQHAHQGRHQLLHRVEGALLVLGHVAAEACEEVALAAVVVIAQRQVHGLMEKVVADVAHHAVAHRGHLCQGKVAEDVLEGIEPNSTSEK